MQLKKQRTSGPKRNRGGEGGKRPGEEGNLIEKKVISITGATSGNAIIDKGSSGEEKIFRRRRKRIGPREMFWDCLISYRGGTTDKKKGQRSWLEKERVRAGKKKNISDRKRSE